VAARLLWGSAFLILSFHTARMALAVRSHGALVGDDIVGFWLARTLSWPAFLITPIDVHFVPLHRLASLALYELAPMSFDASLSALLALHMLTVLGLYRILSALIGPTAAAVACCIYGMHPCVGALLVWWSSGLHRLGYAFCVVSALYSYLRWRSGGRSGWLVAFFVFAVASTGFYCKGALLPLYLIGLDVSLRACRSSPGARSVRVPLLIAGIVAGAYLVVWRLGTDPSVRGVNLDPGFVGKFVELGLWMLIPSVLGVWLDPRLGVYLLVFGTFFALFLATVWGARRAAAAWACMAVALAANMALIGLSAAKANLYGLGVLLGDRYYFENVFLVILFAGIAAGPALQRFSASKLLSLPRVRLAGAALVIAGLVALSLKSGDTFEAIRRANYASSDRARSYMGNLRASLAALPEEKRNPLVLRDSPISGDLVPLGDLVTTSSSLLVLMGESVRVSSRAPYTVASDGTVVRRRGSKRRR
jgi:hypothetical protein